MRIKCPSCGSTAQVELVYSDRNGYSTKRIDEYICGCGCHFEVTFEVTEVRIVKEQKQNEG